MNNLKNLNLRDNEIGSEGMEAFAGAISKGALLSNLETLDLEWNVIRDKGIRAFAEALSLSKGGGEARERGWRREWTRSPRQ